LVIPWGTKTKTKPKPKKTQKPSLLLFGAYSLLGVESYLSNNDANKFIITK
jgi:hypothetical protein